jgi:hypothetical protein
MRWRIGAVMMLVVAFSVLWLPAADAYVDPGSGSFLFQAAIGALLAAGVAVKVFWGRITGVFRRKDAPSDEG